MNTETKAPETQAPAVVEGETVEHKEAVDKNLAAVNAKLTGKPADTSWTPEENATIDGLQQKLGITRRDAIIRLRAGQKKGHSAERVLAEATVRQPKELNKRLNEMGDKAPHLAKPAKAKKGEAKAGRQGKYSKDAIIKAWERGNRPAEIAQLQTPGIKGVSAVYVSRVLFGTTFEGGQTAEQKARHKEEVKRRAKRTGESAE